MTGRLTMSYTNGLEKPCNVCLNIKKNAYICPRTEQHKLKVFTYCEKLVNKFINEESKERFKKPLNMFYVGQTRPFLKQNRKNSKQNLHAVQP